MTDWTASNETLLEQQARRESNARTYPRHLPHAIREAHGVTVVDMDGDEYYDCLAGAGTLILGHNHPHVLDAVEEHLANDRALHTLDITTPIKERFVDTLFESLPDAFAERAKVQFCSPAGTDAVEAALKLVKTATGDGEILGFQGGYHGMTNGALSLMGNTDPKAEISGLMPGVHHMPYPYEYRCPFGVGGDECSTLSSRYIERTLDNPDGGIGDPSGMILELVQGEGGAVPAPDEWTREIRRITRERDIPLIVDEVQTGVGRTGELYAIEHADIVPDVITLSKAIGGSLPLSVVVYDESLDEWEPGAHAGTFRGNQLAMAAGSATIEYVLENDLQDHAETMGERLADRLGETAGKHDDIADVRGRGLMLGVEVVDSGAEPDICGHYPEHPALAERIQAACFDRGLIVELGGRDSSVVRFLPPLIVSPRDVDEIGRLFDEAVEAAIDAQDRQAGVVA